MKRIYKVNGMSSFKKYSSFIYILLLLLLNKSNNLFAEGTKEVSPTSTQIASLSINPGTGAGSYFGASEEDRIYIKIGDFTTEKLYFGLGNFIRTTGAGTPINDVYYRIKNSAGVVVAGPAAVPTSTISTYAQAVAGPNIAGTAPAGYTPIVFTPTANGDYYIELYRSTDMGVTQAAVGTTSANVFHAPFFDFTVANATGTRFPGRIYSQKWSFRATDPASTVPYVGEFDDPISPALYSYTNDKLVVKVDFDDIQPLAFIPAFNSYGVNSATTTDPLITRKSITSGTTAPSLPNSFKTFLTYPDPAQFPPANLAGAPIIQSITGCPGAYTVNYINTAPGDVKVVFDLNGTTGYQAGTTDVLFERLDVAAGTQSIAWDGKDGLGNPVVGNTPFSSNISLLRGRMNMPMYDAEINANGFKISVVTPLANPNVTLYWDDSDATRMTAITGQAANLNQTTGLGINNSVIGQVGPGHAWNGIYGTTLQGPPALPNSGTGSTTPTDGSDDFGNLRTINTWFWALDENSGNGTVRTPACLNLSGNLFNDTDALNDMAVDGSLYTATGEFAVLLNAIGQVVQSVPIVNGTYSFSNVDSGDYKMIITNTQPANGATGIVPSAPNGYTFTGEGITTPGDGTVDGSINFTLVNTNLNNINFGINIKPPVATDDSNLDNVQGTNVSVNILANDKLSDGSTATPTNTSVALTTTGLPAGSTLNANGSVTVPGQGTWTYDPATGVLTFDPLDAFKGNPTPITYVIKETATGLTDTALVTVTYVASLPINLISFSLAQFEDKINLNWRTANETNFSYFEVQRSSTDKEFNGIGKVIGNNRSVYNVVDSNPIIGFNYYRLKMVDLDGTFKFSKVIAVNYEKNGEYIFVENPASNGQIKISTNAKKPQFTLYSGTGKAFSINVNEVEKNIFTIKTSILPAGIYYLNMVTNNSRTTKKIIIH